MKVTVKNIDNTFTEKNVDECNWEELLQQEWFIQNKISKKDEQEKQLIDETVLLDERIEALEKKRLKIKSSFDYNQQSRNTLKSLLEEITNEQRRHLPANKRGLFDFIHQTTELIESHQNN